MIHIRSHHKDLQSSREALLLLSFLCQLLLRAYRIAGTVERIREGPEILNSRLAVSLQTSLGLGIVDLAPEGVKHSEWHHGQTIVLNRTVLG